MQNLVHRSADQRIRRFAQQPRGRRVGKGHISITVEPAAASSLSISAPATVTARRPFSITVTAEDAYGNIATGYTGTVHFSDSVSGATLPANYTFTSGDSGVHTFSKLKLKTKGWETITVTDTLNNTIVGSWLIDVT